jgi:uncharacterized protein (DUF488 family)
MIYTCSFFQHQLYDGRKCSIANSQPPAYDFEVIPALQPGKIVAQLKARQISQEKYVEVYLAQLAAEEELLRRMITFSEKTNVILMCWEKEGNFCHRRLVADHLVKKLGLDENFIEIH